MSIHHLPSAQRPREKMLNQGANALTDAELLAVFFRTGIPGKNAVELAQQALVRFQGLNGLLAAPLGDFSAIPGLGAVKYTQLQAVRELAKRLLVEDLSEGLILNSPGKVSDFLRLHLGGLGHEVFFAVFLDARHRLIVARELFRGSLTETSVYPREVVKTALAHNAAAVIFAHNHPSGDSRPSEADLQLTQRLMLALGLIDIRVLDHFVVAGNKMYSFAEHAKL